MKLFLRWKLSIILFISLFGVIFSFFLGLRIQSQMDQARETIELRELHNKLAQKDADYQLAIENRGKVEKSYQSIYQYADFGIYSPLFLNKKVENNVYNYKENTITERSFNINSDENTKFELWEFTSAQPSDASYLNIHSFEDKFVIFDGYENYGLYPTQLTNIQENWKESYKNKNGIEMYWVNGGGPGYSLIQLEELRTNAHPSLYVLSVTVPINKKGTTQEDLSNAKEYLEKIADTISIERN